MRRSSPLILFDALGINEPGGARTAILYLLDNLFQIRPKWKYIVFVSKKEALFSRFPNVTQIVLPLTKGIFTRLIILIITQLVVWFLKVNLVHFTKSQGGLVIGAKNILTLFDVTTLRFPRLHKPIAVWFWRNIQPFIAKHSDAIVTLSQNAAEDIREYLYVSKDKIHVIPCASKFLVSEIVTLDNFNSVRERYNLPSTYLLFVGALALKKNLSTLIEAYGILQAKGLSIPPLVLIGPQYRLSDASAIFSLIEKLKLSQRIHYLGSVSESDLALIYKHANIFLFPSIHEGFGIPCLEAMACQTPVLASSASAIPEIVGDAAWLVKDYTSPQVWAEYIYKLHNDQNAREELITKGIRQVQKFSWALSAQKLADLYEKLLKPD